MMDNLICMIRNMPKRLARLLHLSYTMNRLYSTFIATSVVLNLLFVYTSSAAMTGQCSNCHTMHNSQGGAVMVSYTYGSETTGAKEFLLRGTCLGCHAMGTSNKIESIGGSDVPQVYHTDSTGDLAGGNFAYLLGNKGSGASDRKGHNIADFGNSDDTYTQPPGRRHDISGISTTFTCAGSRGCHGLRGGAGSGLVKLNGAHHANAGPRLDTASSVANSYRFLYWTKGLENNGQVSSSTKWQNTNASNHNEYFGDTTPEDFDSTSCQTCHESGTNYARPYNQTISGFCATCHGYFHLLNDSSYNGVGDDTVSPFIRHPTDVVLPGSGEYTSYTTYDVTTPVARTTVPTSIGSTVTAGTDVVMCLSCHAAHATDYYKILRWDYTSSTLSTAISGCGNCHTDKN